MSDHIENERRVDGEFHYARLLKWKPSGRQTWHVFRRHDDKILPGSFDNELSAKFSVGHRDQQARHWIEHTQAQINEAASKFANEDGVLWQGGECPVAGIPAKDFCDVLLKSTAAHTDTSRDGGE